MKEAIRMYHLFFPRKWLIVLTYILYPAVVIAINGVLYFMSGSFLVSVVGLMLSVSMTIVYEYILDAYMLYGIAAKDNTALEYIKSSTRGVSLLNVGFCMDGIRRVVTSLVIFGVIYLMARYNFANSRIIIILQCVIMVLLFTEVGLAFTRRTKNVLLNLLVIYLTSAVASALVTLVIEHATLVTVLISGVVLVVLMVMSRKALIKKVRESYYDEGYKAMSQAA